MRDYHVHLVNGGSLDRDGARFRLTIPPTTADAYADAQIDDYEHGLPRVFANTPPVTLRLRARFSHDRGGLRGTAGFGFWNHPFSRAGDVIAPPRNVWFFHGSAESDLRVARGAPGHGFKAAMLNTPPLPLAGGAGSPGRITRALNVAVNAALRARLLARLAMAAGRAVVVARESMLDEAVPDLREWREYALDWRRDVAIFAVDGREALRARRPPLGPLGFVAWIDNYRAVAANGHYAWGYLSSAEAQWMDIEFLE